MREVRIIDGEVITLPSPRDLVLAEMESRGISRHEIEVINIVRPPYSHARLRTSSIRVTPVIERSAGAGFIGTSPRAPHFIPCEEL